MTAKIKIRARSVHSSHRHRPKGVSRRAFEKVYWPYIPVVLIIGLLLSFSGQSGALQAAFARHNGRVLAYATSMSINGLLADTNIARADNGVGSLNLNGKLDAAAQAQANDMVARNYWSHNTPEGGPPWTWVTDQGYVYLALGQNLAAGFNDEQSTINGWLASSLHRENMLNPIYSDVGFGFANNPNYTSAGGGPMTIVVTFYGEPTSVATAVAASTPSNSSTSSPSTTSSKAAASATVQTPASGMALAYRTSRANLAFAKLPFASFATGLATFGVIAAVGFWLSRHLLKLRRALTHSEAYIFNHPLMDVGLLIIAALSYLLSQTAGFIQ
ncbi:MAG: CAP domain-containing protein [Candidatus Saccharimonadales bacterium]|jgi:hypothetical protein